MSLKIITSLGDLYMETNNSKEGLECYLLAINKNPLALCTIKKYLSYASIEVSKNFIIQVCNLFSDNFPKNDALSLNKFIQARNLAQLPKNFKTACQMFFSLRTTNKIHSKNGSLYNADNIKEAGII